MTAARVRDNVLLFAGLIVAWQLVYLVVGALAIASPLATVERAALMLGSAWFWPHAEATGIAFIYGMTIAVVGGAGVGVLLGANRLAADVADPILGALYSIPKVTLYPVVLLIFGLGISAKVAFGALHGFFPVAIFAMNGIRTINPVYIKSARTLRLGHGATIWTVLMPAALPEIMAGVRVGASLALFGTLIGELFAAQRGIGFLLMRNIDQQNVTDIMALTLLLFAAATLVNAGLVAIEHRVQHHR